MSAKHFIEFLHYNNNQTYKIGLKRYLINALQDY